MSKKSGSKNVAGQSISLIPRPAKMQTRPGAFRLGPGTVICAGMATGPEARLLAKTLAPATGFQLQVREVPAKAPAKRTILLALDPEALELGDEGYRLTVEKERVVATALKPAGIFYACQTMRQLLPPEILRKRKVSSGVDWIMPCVTVEDIPRFPWRGHLFDCARHFFTVAEVKRSIDLLALHKLNRLHWHLTEDQGWRIEIKRYPELTRVGAWRKQKDGKLYGGFYTQDQVREIVAYAAERHIVVVPEIEMPGHSSAALASYPELGCTGGPYQVQTSWGIFREVYCAGQELTFRFLESVLDEVLELFPSQYIHIGGDECPKDSWRSCRKCQTRIKAEGLKDEHELQSYFIKRFDKYLAERGRRLIGWDEILEGGLAPGAVVQSWRGTKGGIEAASSGHDVVMSPTSHCYLDYSYATTSVEKAADYEPVPEELPAEKASHVLGLEGNMWTEWVPNQDRCDFQVYPRMCALAEAAWSPAAVRRDGDFAARMVQHEKRLGALGVKFGVAEQLSTEGATLAGNWKAVQMKERGLELQFDVTQLTASPGKYETVLWYTEGSAGIQIEWVALLQNGKEVERDTHLGWSGADKRDVVYRFAVKKPLPGARRVIKVRVRPLGGTNSNGDIYLKKVK